MASILVLPHGQKWLLEHQISHPYTTQKKRRKGGRATSVVVSWFNWVHFLSYFLSYWCYFVMHNGHSWIGLLWSPSLPLVVMSFILPKATTMKCAGAGLWHSLLKTWLSCRRKLQYEKGKFQVLTARALLWVAKGSTSKHKWQNPLGAILPALDLVCPTSDLKFSLKTSPNISVQIFITFWETGKESHYLLSWAHLPFQLTIP